MSSIYLKLQNAYESIQGKIPFTPKAALVLGSGLGDFAVQTDISAAISYKEIPDFPVSTVEGHNGRFIFAKIHDIPMVMMQGRVHYYEGYSMQDVVMPIRLMKMMGADILVLTNAAGGIDRNFKSGTLMMITDQISSFVPSPLVGENLSEFGTRFPDMTEIYSKRLRVLLKSAAKSQNIPLSEGVYLQTTGPNYESPAEIRMFESMGASAVGMSTACEAVAAKHAGFEICGVSCITNMASGIGSGELKHDEVQETANKVQKQFSALIDTFFLNLSKEEDFI